MKNLKIIMFYIKNNEIKLFNNKLNFNLFYTYIFFNNFI